MGLDHVWPNILGNSCRHNLVSQQCSGIELLLPDLKSEQTDRHTHKQTHIWTFRLIESIGPEGRCFENAEQLFSYFPNQPKEQLVQLSKITSPEIAKTLMSFCGSENCARKALEWLYLRWRNPHLQLPAVYDEIKNLQPAKSQAYIPKAADPSVKLTVYYESLCGDSLQWVMLHLNRVWTYSYFPVSSPPSWPLTGNILEKIWTFPSNHLERLM